MSPAMAAAAKGFLPTNERQRSLAARGPSNVSTGAMESMGMDVSTAMGTPSHGDITRDVIEAKGTAGSATAAGKCDLRTWVELRTYADRMPWIRTIAPEDATDRLAELYGWQSAALGRPTDFTQLGS